VISIEGCQKTYTLVDAMTMLFTANRQELDITLLAEPSSDEDEELTKRSKCRRRKQAAARGTDNKADIRLLPTSALASSDQAADSSSQTMLADSRFIPPAKTRKRMKSRCHFLSCFVIMRISSPV